MTAHLTPKAATYGLIAVLGLGAALASGRVELIALVAPIMTALAGWLGLSRRPELRIDFVVEGDAFLEGDKISTTVRVATDVDVSEADIALVVPEGLSALHDADFTITLRAGELRELEVPLRAERWGGRSLGTIAARAWGPGRMLAFETVEDRTRSIRVYPGAEKMVHSLTPPATQVYAGNYVSRASGDGIEFSEVRPYVPGDSRKHVNWRVTSRRSTLHVNTYHVERNADVVLFLDTFADVGTPGSSSLDRTVRGAATLARHYLLRKDRVGLVSFGGLLGWIWTNSGRPHLHRIVDYLIGVEASLSYARKDIRFLPSRSLPQAALIVVFTPLVDQRALRAFADLHARGYHLVVVDTLRDDDMSPGPTAEDALAHRAWVLERAAKRFDLESLGIPIVPWPASDALEAALGSLPPLNRMPRLRRAL